ncbi:uncharacterized protein LOC119110021 [Pollicipes pollicipes]|uniref:uncharacterized protein LOC119110021 n=1 Tax=Pollicipes pollicipes TaxID=41117 RepID=UPI0018852D40|nr:uncharacterized protein LOC119110021 [Pollicipes pollicipes]
MNGKQGDGTMALRRNSRSFNSLPRHLPSTYSVPYGFKIDLDFVRFCDNYYDNKESQRPVNRLRRTKRSHKKSYDSLLGLRREKADKQKSVSPPVQAPAPVFPSVRSAPDRQLASDLESSLGQVMSDFEETLERSRAATHTSPAYLSDGAGYRPPARRYHSLPRPGSLRSWRDAERDLPRASSNSSLSDSSEPAGPTARSADIAREMAETISSLQRLSQMEDGPEPRPARRGASGDGRAAAGGPEETAERLHKLSVLREEKRAMEQVVRSRPRRDPTPELASEGPERESRLTLRSRSLSPAPDAVLRGRRVQQDASTSCRVLTRDVGVSGGPPSRGATPPQESSAARVITRDRSVGVLTELNAGQAEPGRRRISLEAILSGRGGSRSVGVATSPPRLGVGRTHVEEVRAAPPP